jgi:hypothetical protein
MSRSSGELLSRAGSRAQVEPLAALAAVFAVIVGLGVYAGALDAVVPAPGREEIAPTALDATVAATSDPTGAVAPGRLANASDATPEGRQLNATLRTNGRRWTVGPPIPAGGGDRASRRVAVRWSSDRTALGRLRVVVW